MRLFTFPCRVQVLRLGLQCFQFEHRLGASPLSRTHVKLCTRPCLCLAYLCYSAWRAAAALTRFLINHHHVCCRGLARRLLALTLLGKHLKFTN
jgi:hypothetical protein